MIGAGHRERDIFGYPYSRFLMYVRQTHALAREALRFELVIARTAQAADGQAVTDLMRELEGHKT